MQLLPVSLGALFLGILPGDSLRTQLLACESKLHEEALYRFSHQQSEWSQLLSHPSPDVTHVNNEVFGWSQPPDDSSNSSSQLVPCCAPSKLLSHRFHRLNKVDVGFCHGVAWTSVFFLQISKKKTKTNIKMGKGYQQAVHPREKPNGQQTKESIQSH